MEVSSGARPLSHVARLKRSGPAYLIGCFLAAFWVAVRTGGAPAQLAEDSVTLIPPTTGEQFGYFAFLYALAFFGCLIPVLLGRWALASRGIESRGWFAAIWALAAALVASGFNPFTLFNPITAPALIWNFAVPGAIIGVIVHAIETRGKT